MEIFQIVDSLSGGFAHLSVWAQIFLGALGVVSVLALLSLALPRT